MKSDVMKITVRTVGNGDLLLTSTVTRIKPSPLSGGDRDAIVLEIDGAFNALSLREAEEIVTLLSAAIQSNRTRNMLTVRL